MDIFENFDFSILDSPSFKEDAVREEIIFPILRRVGYKSSGEIRTERSKSLVHPFVMIGSKKRRINIVPDYTLYFRQKPLMILEAKAPCDSIFQSQHVEQSYSYAIHPDVRCEYYGLCNGRELIIYHIRKWNPVFRIDIPLVDRHWDEVYKHLHPTFLEMPELRELMDDYGLHARKAGFTQDTNLIFIDYFLQDIMKVSDTLFTSTSNHKEEGRDFCVSFDYTNEVLLEIVAHLPEDYAHELNEHLQQQPFRFDVDGKINISCRGRLGELTQGEFELFVPVKIEELIEVAFHADVKARIESRLE